MPENLDATAGRRRFLAGSASAAGLLILKPQTVFGSQANSTVEVGLIGCGGRGNWIAPFFPEYAGARVVAVADVVRANLDTTRDKLKVDASRAYYGPNAYKELSQSKLDAVVIETPPYYHPEQAMAAVDAGKHVYLAKPVAVDVPGCRTVSEAGRKAKGKVSFLVDFQSRSQPVFQEAASRVHRGDLGKVVMAQVFYFAGRPSKSKREPGMEDGLVRMKNFYMDRVLGGDIIVEQNVHVLDMANWFIGSHPLKANGMGGRTDWTGTPFSDGDAYDHFAVNFWYPNETHVSFSSNQLHRSFSDLCVRCFGNKGALDAHYGGEVKITGDNAWKGADKDPTFKDGAVNNVKTFVESIKTGKLVNIVEDGVTSTLTAILGRTAAYRQSTVTWDEMMKANERLESKLKLRW